VALLGWIIRLLLRRCGEKPSRGGRDSQKVPSHIYRKPDPMIYDQRYLASLGLAVTWDNPDIHLERPGDPGVHVDSHALDPGTEYTVIARIWNGSKYASAPWMQVRFWYLDFGVGGGRNPIADTRVDLPALGAPGCPAFASVRWTTPPQAGHYCLQVELVWTDDENPDNNLGQHNTDVKALNSPRAAFSFAVRNDAPRRRTLRLAADAYAIPSLEACKPKEGGDDADARRRRARERHNPERYPVPAGWQVNLEPAEVTLAPGEQIDATAEVIAPDGFRGRQAINVNALENAVLRGGVTLYAEGSGDG
jgi:hypothetical protein